MADDEAAPGPCENCGVPVVAENLLQLVREAVGLVRTDSGRTMLVELFETEDEDGDLTLKLQEHTIARCQALRRGDEPPEELHASVTRSD